MEITMSKGYSKKVLERLYKVFLRIKSGKKRALIIKEVYGGDKRLYAIDFAKLRKAGIRLSYSRKKDIYKIENWLNVKTFTFKFNQEEFFKFFMVISQLEELDLHKKLSLALSDETDAIFDVGPAYGISQNITAEITDILDKIKNAILDRKKLVIRYHSLSEKQVSNRVIHPYKLIHTPISWYVVAWCETKKDFYIFKLARISEITAYSDKFQRKTNFSIEKILGDAWWVRHDPKKKPPYIVKVLFINEAADAIKEYKFHKTQKLESVEEGTLATWQLSYLEEFATWLLQWLGNFKIIEPNELKNIISKKIKIQQNI